jgi:spore germination protein GerM
MSSMPTPPRLPARPTRQRGVRDWLATLTLRDRLIYGTLLSVMLMIIGIYMVLAVQLLLSDDPPGGSGEPLDAVAAEMTPTAAAVAAGGAALPGEPVPTVTATIAASPILVPTALPTVSPTPEHGAPTATPMPQPGATSQERVTLYFSDASNTLLVPVNRQITVAPGQIITATLNELIAGPAPGSGLNGSLAANMQLLGVSRDNDANTLTVNLDREPSSITAIEGMVLTLTEMPDLSTARVRIQVQGNDLDSLNGQDVPTHRFAVNVDNPQNLPEDFGSRETSFLPLYFRYNGDYVRITRLVPRTQSPAAATVRELIEGPGSYSHLLENPIPDDTQLRSIGFVDDAKTILRVDLSQAFADAADQDAALDVLVLSLTELRDSQGERIIQQVEVLVEGRSLSEYWGPAYNQRFARPALNPW